MSKVRCNKCGWEGDEDGLATIETFGDATGTITAIETPGGQLLRRLPKPENPFYFKACFQCETDAYLMDIDEEESFWLYQPENSDKPIGKEEFMEAAKGNEEYARHLRERVKWQHPATLVDEDLREGEVYECGGMIYMADKQEENLLGFLSDKTFNTDLDHYGSWYCPELITRLEELSEREEDYLDVIRYEEEYVRSFLTRLPQIVALLKDPDEANGMEILNAIRANAEYAYKNPTA